MPIRPIRPNPRLRDRTKRLIAREPARPWSEWLEQRPTDFWRDYQRGERRRHYTSIKFSYECDEGLDDTNTHRHTDARAVLLRLGVFLETQETAAAAAAAATAAVTAAVAAAVQGDCLVLSSVIRNPGIAHVGW